MHDSALAVVVSTISFSGGSSGGENLELSLLEDRTPTTQLRIISFASYPCKGKAVHGSLDQVVHSVDFYLSEEHAVKAFQGGKMVAEHTRPVHKNNVEHHMDPAG